MKKLTLIVLALTMLNSCTNSNRDHRDNASSDTTHPLLDTINKAQTYTADVNLSGNEKVFLLNASLITQRLTEFAHLAAQRANDLSLRKQANKIEDDYRKMQDNLQSIAKGKGILLSNNGEAEELSLLKKQQGVDFDDQYVKLILSAHANLIQELNTAIKLPNKDIVNFATKGLVLVNQNNSDIAKILK